MGTADIQLSKRLSWLLRHGGTSAGLQIDRRGYAFVDDILSRDDFKRVTVTQIRHIVATNSKQRFALETDADGRVMIRANQGHTIDDVNELGEHDNASARGTSADLTPITNDNMPRVCVHGTYARNWSSICADGGLSRMRRNHVHMAAGVGGAQVISGMRADCDMYIFVDVDAAIHDGRLQFYLSSNGVILSPGDKLGRIPTLYFSRVQRRAADGSLENVQIPTM